MIHPKVEDEIVIILVPTTSKKYDFDESKAIVVITENNPLNSTNSTTATNPHSFTTRQFNFIHPSVQQCIPDATKHHQFQHTVQIKKLHPSAHIPTKGTEGAIGLDVSTTTSTTILPGKLATIPTGLATAFSTDIYLRIAPRSSLSMKQISVEETYTMSR